MPRIIEISSYFTSKTNFKKSVLNVRCNEHQVLVDYLTQFSYKHSIDGLYKTYLFLTSDEKAAAYISFSITTIDGNDAKNYLDVPLGLNYPIPALKITRLLTSDEFIKRGIATELLTFAEVLGFILSCQTGCKAIVVDAKNEAVDFYKNNDFDVLSIENDSPDTLLMIKKIQTIKEYIENKSDVIEEFIDFCNDYSLEFFKASLTELNK